MKINVLIISLVVLLGACESSENKTTKTNSSHFTTKAEKLHFLKKYLVAHSLVLDAEYAITYQDNSTGMIPGPSDWLIKAAVKIDADSVNNWLRESPKIDFQIRLDLWKELALSSPTWQLKGPQELYSDGQTIKVVYRTQGILLACYTTTFIDINQYKIPE